MAEHPGPLDEELAQERDLTALPDPVQLDLIRDAVPGRDAGTAVAVMQRRGRGRPPGARNRRNAKFRDQILSMGPHPALVMQRATAMPVEQLAAVLQCTLLEAYQVQLRAAGELLPYIEGKQPIQIDLRQEHDVVLIMGGAPGVVGADLEAIANEVNDEEGAIDWGGVEFEDLPDAVRNGEPLRDSATDQAD